MNKYFKIFLLLGAAFVISDFSIKNVFLAKSPKLNPFLAQNIITKINNNWDKTTNFLASINFFQINSQKTFSLSQQQITDVLQAPLNKISQGVYAGEKNNTQVYEVRINEIDYLEYTFDVDNKKIKIKVPKDQKPPSKETIETLYK